MVRPRWPEAVLSRHHLRPHSHFPYPLSAFFDLGALAIQALEPLRVQSVSMIDEDNILVLTSNLLGIVCQFLNILSR